MSGSYPATYETLAALFFSDSSVLAPLSQPFPFSPLYSLKIRFILFCRESSSSSSSDLAAGDPTLSRSIKHSPSFFHSSFRTSPFYARMRPRVPGSCLFWRFAAGRTPFSHREIRAGLFSHLAGPDRGPFFPGACLPSLVDSGWCMFTYVALPLPPRVRVRRDVILSPHQGN